MSDKPISRFPVPDINRLPGDIQERILEADISPRRKAMLDSAVKVSWNACEINDSDYEAPRARDCTDGDIRDIGAVSGFFALSNRLADMMNIRPNDELYLLGRVPKEPG